jgi:hypothetical protein
MARRANDRKIQLSVGVTPIQLSALESEAKMLRISISDVIRRVLDARYQGQKDVPLSL